MFVISTIMPAMAMSRVAGYSIPLVLGDVNANISRPHVSIIIILKTIFKFFEVPNKSKS